MSAQTLVMTGVVEQMLDHARHGRWEALEELLDENFEIVEPDSLPYGGTHHGVAGYVALMQRIAELFELTLEPIGVSALDDHSVLVRMHARFVARSTGRSVRLGVVELPEVVGGRVRRSEVFLSDTAALVATLERA
ncbi:MAG TPA: nuclear transport factor 2 family protein [Solirubrobacteraceae bacterium]|nr:nuclear transport factor 2 family protein [Solirubrobacteraceae bacterium]